MTTPTCPDCNAETETQQGYLIQPDYWQDTPVFNTCTSCPWDDLDEIEEQAVDEAADEAYDLNNNN